MRDYLFKYKIMYIWWHIWVKRVMNVIAALWGAQPNVGSIVAYPLYVDIGLGIMMQYYFKYGFISTFKRCWSYNKVLAARISGHKEEDLTTFGMSKEAIEERNLEEEFQKVIHKSHCC